MAWIMKANSTEMERPETPKALKQTNRKASCRRFAKMELNV